ncbi:hypothetical protein D9757_009755 [Collybiopsis confluens]|uniref:Nephrocystin 3-like N-terminal domain-containing protein n=1 Tax=Collybiopsis confluens TaxID=2823264 RepID=A0A8H5GYL2_9AGAR|nr:hypothetical protein D9757_009755 [Collybiopsis confluens]
MSSERRAESTASPFVKDQTNRFNQSNMRKMYNSGKTKAKKVLDKYRSRSVTPTGTGPSTLAPAADHRSQVEVSSTPGSRPSTPTAQVNTTLDTAGRTPETDNLQSQVVVPEVADLTPTSETTFTTRAVVDTVETALGVLKEVSAAFPPLQAVVGGVIECINIYKKVSGNTDALKSLAKDLIQRTEFLQAQLTQEGLEDASEMVGMEALAKKLEDIYKGVKQETDKGNLAKFVQQSQIGEKIQLFKERVQHAYDEWKMQVQSAIQQEISKLLNEHILEKLKYAPEAFYDTDVEGIQRQYCLQGTRTRIIDQIKHWANDPNGSTGYWIWGMAGTGKSTIAMSACQAFQESKDCALVASFFCSRQIAECSNYRKIIPTLAYKLARSFRRFAVELKKIYGSDPDIAGKRPEIQVLKLLIEPWKAVAVKGLHRLKVPIVVLDALDECPEIQVVLRPLIAAIQGGQLPDLKLLFTSRPEYLIQLLMPPNQLPTEIPSTVKQFRLHDVGDMEIQSDIYTFLDNELQGVATNDDQLQKLAELSGKLFIYAATVVKFIKGVMDPAQQQTRLKDSLAQTEKPEDLQKVYSTIVESAIHNNLRAPEAQNLRQILNTIITLYQPLTCKGVAEMVSLPQSTVEALIRSLQAVCYISDKNECIYTFHLSFSEYIMGGKEYGDAHRYHQSISKSCFQQMKRLRFNICELPSSFTPDDEVVGLEKRVKERIEGAIEYSCMFWVDHVMRTEATPDLMKKMNDFLQDKGIYWIEAMNLMKALPRCGDMMKLLIEEVISGQNTELRQMSKDLYNLLTMFGGSDARKVTPHLYLSTIPFWRIYVEGELGRRYNQTLRIKHSRRSNQEVVAMNLHNLINAVAVSENGRIAVGLGGGGEIRILYASTGMVIGNPLLGHTNWVNSVAFSPDGTRIVSGSDDQTVRIWDAATGTQVGDPLLGHTSEVYSVAFSPDGRRIVSGSGDQTVRIWDAATGTQVGDPLLGHTDWVRSVGFSPDGTRIVSGSDDQTVRIWDAATGTHAGDPLLGHTNLVCSVAFSPDGTRIVSSSGDQTVRIWDAATGTQVGDPLLGHTNLVCSVAFSPDGTRIVSNSRDQTVRIWDAATGTQVGDPLLGHTNSVCSVAFSPDGTRIVSGSDDQTVRIWDAATRTQVGDPLLGHTDWVRSVGFSPDGTRIVSGSDDQTVRIWDAAAGTQVGDPLLGHANSVWSVACSPDGTRIVSGSGDQTVRIWDAATGTQVGDPLLGHTNLVCSVAFSPDGTRIVSSSDDQTVRIWDAATGTQVGDPLLGHTNLVCSVAFSPDGTRIVSGSGDQTVRIWDAATGTQVGDPLLGHTGWVRSVTFSPDGTRIVSGSGDQAVRIWDAATGTQVGDPLLGHTNSVCSVAFSPDGTRIVSGSGDQTVRVWDTATGTQAGDPLLGHTDWVHSVVMDK